MFKSAGLQTKLIVLISSLTLLVLLVLGTTQYYKYQHEYQKTADILAKELRNDMERSIHSKMDIGLTNAVSFSSNNRIIEEVAKQDRQGAINTLKNVNQAYAKNTEFKSVKIHIHTPDNHSFLRAWKPEKYGDDLSSFRFGVAQVIKDQKAIAVLELGRTGLAVRGIAPLFQGNTYIGSLEFIQGMGSLARNYASQDKKYLLLLNEYALTISTSAKNNTPIGAYVLGNQKWFTPEAITMGEKIDWNRLNQKGWLVQDDMLITQSLVKDLQGKDVGIQVIGAPTTELNQSMAVIESAIFKEFGLLIGIVLLMAITILFAVRKLVLNPVTHLQHTIRLVTREGDFSARAQTSDSEDEIANMASDFNQLLGNIQQVLGETAHTLLAIRDGDLSQRIQVSTVGALDELKQAVNQTADTLDTTMQSLGKTLTALGNANFSETIERDSRAKGAFKEALDNGELTLKTLSIAMSEITDVLVAMAKSNFSHKVETPLTGDLQTVQQNINLANHNLHQAFDSFASRLSQLTQGDLTTTVKGDYQGQLAKLKDIINNSLANIASMFSEIKTTSEGALSNVHQLASGNQNLNERTQNQAASIEETAAAMEEITSTVQNSLSNAKEANELAQLASKDAQEGEEVMDQAKTAMHGIHASSAKITDITSLIDGIAFQTNLLALNAAVEAARAGEHGRGFAVVAGEVRTLAQRTADAAKEIKFLIEDTTSQIEHGSALASRSSDMLQQINKRISSVSGMVSEISKAAEEQSMGISQINQAIGSLDDSTQQNATLVDQVTHDTQNMSQQVQKLVDLTSAFKIDTIALSLTTTLETGNFEFARARRAHRGWRSHISGLLHTGDSDEAVHSATDKHACGLGQWIEGEGQAYRETSEFQTLVKIHDQMHDEIYQALQRNHANPDELTQEEVAHIEQVSKDVIDAINILEKKAANPHF